MKKHLKVILIVISILSVCGVGLWFAFSRTKTETLPNTVSAFVEHSDSQDLHLRLTTSQTLYSKHYSDTRLNSLKSILTKLDEFEQDLNTYLILCDVKPKETKTLTTSYKNLSSSRKNLIKDCDEYIVRMKGNTLAEGQTIKTLYNNLFDKVKNYLLEYNSCFANTSSFVFSSVASSSSIKSQLYSLYSYGVTNTLTNISNSQFKSLTTINRLNSVIKLDTYGNPVLKDSVAGGEFNILALDFKNYYNNSNKNELISNFDSYYTLNINPETETSNEKLAVYYFKQIMEV